MNFSPPLCISTFPTYLVSRKITTPILDRHHHMQGLCLSARFVLKNQAKILDEEPNPNSQHRSSRILGFNTASTKSLTLTICISKIHLNVIPFSSWSSITLYKTFPFSPILATSPNHRGSLRNVYRHLQLQRTATDIKAIHKAG
jgi:hypothetical protein